MPGISVQTMIAISYSPVVECVIKIAFIGNGIRYSPKIDIASTSFGINECLKYTTSVESSVWHVATIDSELKYSPVVVADKGKKVKVAGDLKFSPAILLSGHYDTKIGGEIAYSPTISLQKTSNTEIDGNLVYSVNLSIAGYRSEEIEDCGVVLYRNQKGRWC